DLVKLSGVSHDRPEIFSLIRFESDRLGKRFTNDSANLADNIARLDENPFSFNPFRKSNNLFHNFGPSLCARFDHCENKRILRGIGTAPEHLSTHQNWRQDIV